MATPTLLGYGARRLFHDLWRDPALVGLWRLNEAEGDLVDASPRYRLDLTAVGSPTRGADLGYGVAGLTLNGSSQYAKRASASATELGFLHNTPFSVVVLASQASGTTGTLASKLSGGSDKGWLLQVLNSGKTWFILKSGSGAEIAVISASGRSTSTVYMLGCSYSGSGAASGVALYSNGAVDTSSVSTDALGTATANTADFNIGGYDNGSALWPGSIGMVAVFNAAKAAADFQRWASLAGVA